MSLSNKLILSPALNKYTFFVAQMLGCRFQEIKIGDYVYDSHRPCPYVAIIGNVDLSGQQNLSLKNLRFVQGNLILNDSQNLCLGVEFVGENVFAKNAKNLDLENLKNVKGGVYCQNATIKSFENLEDCQVLIVDRKNVERKSAHVCARAKLQESEHERQL